MKWSISAAKEGVACEFNGIPIMSAENAQFHCHQGVDIDLPQKTKRKQMQDEKQVQGYLGLFYIYHLQLNLKKCIHEAVYVTTFVVLSIRFLINWISIDIFLIN